MPEKWTGVNVQTPNGHGGPGPVASGSGAVLIYATFPSLPLAEAIGSAIVEAGLAACVNLLPGMLSIYRWQGAVHRDEEIAAIIKTRACLAARVVGWVRVAHPYANPALVSLPAVGGSPDFLAWITEETRGAAG